MKYSDISSSKGYPEIDFMCDFFLFTFCGYIRKMANHLKIETIFEAFHKFIDEKFQSKEMTYGRKR